MDEKTTDDSWYDSLPEELRTAPLFKPNDDGVRKTTEQLVMDLNNLTQVAGNSLRMPGPDAGDEDISAFQARVMEKVPGLMTMPNLEDPESISAHFNKMGKPEKPEDYAIPEIEGFEPKNPGELKAKAHAMNMTQAQFAAFVNDQASSTISANQAFEAQYAEQNEIVKGEWGAAYEQNIKAVDQLLKTNKDTPPDLIEAFDSGKLPATMMRYLLSMSELSAEGSTFERQNEGGDTILAPAEAMDQLLEIENRLFASDMSAARPEYKILLAKRNKLMLQAYPNSAVDIAGIRA